MAWWFWVLAIASVVLPDAVVAAFGLGISYVDMLGHRGLTHSAPFAMAWAFLVLWFEFRQIVRFSGLWRSL